MSLAIALDLPNQTLNLSRGLTNSSSARYARSLLAGFNNTPAGLSTGDLDSWYYNQGACFKDALSNSFSRLGSSYSSRHLRLARALAFVKGVGSWQLGTDFDQQQLTFAQSVQSFFNLAPLVFRFEAEAFTSAFDTTAGNSGGATGSWTAVNPDVDVEIKEGNDSPSLGYTDSGDWVQFNRPANMTDGNYRLKLKYSRDGNPTCEGFINSTVFTMPATGSWNSFVVLDSVATIPITSADTNIRLTIGNVGFNIDWFELTRI